MTIATENNGSEEEPAHAELKNTLDNDALAIGIDYLSACWASFELTIQDPSVEVYAEPRLLEAEYITETTQKEFVYTIHDHGASFSTSKAEDMYVAGASMGKFYSTIEKIIFLLIERLKSLNIDKKTEVHVTFQGDVRGMRKAFESIISLEYNVVVDEFNPGKWGKDWMKNVSVMEAKNLGLPKPAPRRDYQRDFSSPLDSHKNIKK